MFLITLHRGISCFLGNWAWQEVLGQMIYCRFFQKNGESRKKDGSRLNLGPCSYMVHQGTWRATWTPRLVISGVKRSHVYVSGRHWLKPGPSSLILSVLALYVVTKKPWKRGFLWLMISEASVQSRNKMPEEHSRGIAYIVVARKGRQQTRAREQCYPPFKSTLLAICFFHWTPLPNSPSTDAAIAFMIQIMTLATPLKIAAFIAQPSGHKPSGNTSCLNHDIHRQGGSDSDQGIFPRAGR